MKKGITGLEGLESLNLRKKTGCPPVGRAVNLKISGPDYQSILPLVKVAKEKLKI